MSINTRLLSLKDFYSYLASFDSLESVVGLAGHPEECPLARFLKSRGFTNVRVNSVIVNAADKRVGGQWLQQTPDWAADFIAYVDDAFGERAQPYVTVMNALKALDDTGWSAMVDA